MKRIRIRKPDIKGTFQKLRNLKKEDIKEHFRQRKLRRQAILEKRRNSAFAKNAAGIPGYEPVFGGVPHPVCLCAQSGD